jgi:hypothetical protein
MEGVQNPGLYPSTMNEWVTDVNPETKQLLRRTRQHVDLES